MSRKIEDHLIDGFRYKKYPFKPVPKPRMTRSDKWNKRDCVLRYREFKDEVKRYGIRLPADFFHVIFVLPIPKTTSKKKVSEMAYTKHLKKPDKDNLEKALLDAVYDNDSHVWDSRVTKIWGGEKEESYILIGVKDDK